MVMYAWRILALLSSVPVLPFWLVQVITHGDDPASGFRPRPARTTPRRQIG